MFRTSTYLETLGQGYAANMKSGQENHKIILNGLTPIFVSWSEGRCSGHDIELVVDVRKVQDRDALVLKGHSLQ